ncbi:MAG: hypothetical protein J6X44_01810 [Thermoguttaceae bacterium]|nr:hypothetical protein [Thermoguttaceae bacterium]
MFSKTQKGQKGRAFVDESKRRNLKRIAFLAGAILIGSTLVASSGCKTGDDSRPKTVPGFLSLDTPE